MIKSFCSPFLYFCRVSKVINLASIFDRSSPGFETEQNTGYLKKFRQHPWWDTDLPKFGLISSTQLLRATNLSRNQSLRIVRYCLNLVHGCITGPAELLNLYAVANVSLQKARTTGSTSEPPVAMHRNCHRGDTTAEKWLSPNCYKIYCPI